MVKKRETDNSLMIVAIVAIVAVVVLIMNSGGSGDIAGLRTGNVLDPEYPGSCSCSCVDEVITIPGFGSMQLRENNCFDGYRPVMSGCDSSANCYCSCVLMVTDQS